MQFAVEAGGRPRRISVTRTGSTFAIQVDDRTYRVDATRVDAHTLSLVVDGVSSIDAVVAPGPGTGQMTVTVAGVPVPVTLNGRHRGRHDSGAHGGGPQRVVAPMPGKVVRVLVKPGDAVEVRQPLVVVEAMKMENELRAAGAGTVSEVHAREGQSVDTGALLVMIS